MNLHHLRKCLTYTKYTSIGILAGSITSAYHHRPIPTNTQPSSPPPCDTPFLLRIARTLTISTTTLAIRLLLYGRYTLHQDSSYHHFLSLLLHRPPHEGILTVSNHRSLFDDPGVLSCLLPLSLMIRPEYNRWGICSQEYCFNDALPGLVKGYIGAGKVLPIRRGGGIDQPWLLEFGRHLARGEWCHVFPEGGVWQWEELGGRRELPVGGVCRSSSDIPSVVDVDGENSELVVIAATKRQKALPASNKGKLKWGVGKLIAHAPVTPRVIPFAHVGMERLLPQDEVTGKTTLRKDWMRGMLPGGDGLDVRIQFGEEIRFDDLIAEHEARYGKLWKYGGEAGAEELRRWVSKEEDRLLYSAIVKRIEHRLEVVTKKVYLSCNT